MTSVHSLGFNDGLFVQGFNDDVLKFLPNKYTSSLMDEMIRSLLQFQAWANARILTALRDSNDENSRALKLFAHVLTTEKIWLLRLQGKDTVGTDKSPELNLTQCEAMAKENHAGLSRVLDEAVGHGLDVMIGYKNLSGKEFSTSVRDILTHVIIHGAHHRGQIALALRSSGAEPPNIDFITFVRQIG